MAMFYAAVWICLPRMFLGVHYASDTVAGAAIGMVTVWASMRARWLQSNVAAPLLAFAEARPGSFYVTAFLGSFEMAALFDDVRAAGGTVLRIFQIDPRYWPSLGAIAGASALVFLAIVSAVCPESSRNDANAGSSGDVSNPRSLTVSATIHVE